jgi:hypothetical protein
MIVLTGSNEHLSEDQRRTRTNSEAEPMQTKRISRQKTSDAPVTGSDQPDHEQMQRNLQLIQVLDSFLEGDADEQRETWEYLERVLDEDRGEGRKLFR